MERNKKIKALILELINRLEEKCNQVGFLPPSKEYGALIKLIRQAMGNGRLSRRALVDKLVSFSRHRLHEVTLYRYEIGTVRISANFLKSLSSVVSQEDDFNPGISEQELLEAFEASASDQIPQERPISRTLLRILAEDKEVPTRQELAWLLRQEDSMGMTLDAEIIRLLRQKRREGLRK